MQIYNKKSKNCVFFDRNLSRFFINMLINRLKHQSDYLFTFFQSLYPNTAALALSIR